MLPEFPKFKPIELSDKVDVEKITHKYPPYSDFNFVSMWSWDIKGEMRLSKLYDNLVVRFTDYLTGEPFYSFLGSNKVNETVEALLQLSEQEGLKLKLKLVPEDSLKDLDKTRFKMHEDKDHFDYVYKISELQSFSGGKFAKKRNQIASFLKNHQNAEAKTLDLRDKNTQASIINLCLEWIKTKMDKEDIFESHEETAVNRMLLATDASNLMGTGIFIGGKMAAFFIEEIMESEYIVAHASKIDRSFVGVNSFLMKKNAEILATLNKDLFNYEQDLGIEKLRDAKARFRPALFLKSIS